MAALLRCSVCSERLSADDFASSLCRFHVGAYGGAAWRCCAAPGEDAPGCAAGCHVRAEAQPAQQPDAGGDGSEGDENARCLDREAEGEAAPPPDPFISVVLSASDTLAGIALRYNTTPEAIMAANSMLSPLSFNARRVLRVPTQDPPPPEKAPDRRLLVQRVASAASARRGHVATAEEASAYLDLAGGDVALALRAMEEDADWESRSVATAFEAARRPSGDGGARAAAAGAAAVAAAAAAVADGLRAVRSSIASAVAAGGAGGDGGADDKLD